ncbi:putative hydroxymethylpyrimidine transport system ATP-binding protein [Salinihabitans flavidus]|uniref:Putative hydroxymethylpyrimidine transport system ATP-binding protein n=1 Tax=Salinihabitans flavidus TaxID=569882 RepID=A0A1H8NKA8_9RHOB|nr:ATP-binding cassette domain-containing protein [Salinihabitans flavidus]SEO29929.1 putative hydroxymethylpyrimidine transport system ATP-binding protein [Salinihabitans flavidus]
MTAPGLSLRGDLWLGEQALIRDLALDLPAGRWSCLLGPSGVGKSTLGRLVAGLPGPHRLDGGLRASDGAPLAGRVAMMAQDGQLLPWAGAERNVTIGARLRGQRPDRARARALLADVGLNGMARRRPGSLSGGERQRVALARTLIEECPVVVLDEPFSALDAATRLAMQDLAARLLQGRTVILITHDPLEAVRLADRAWILGTGGAEALELPGTAPPRSHAQAATLEMQASLLSRLQGMQPA